AAGLAQRLGRRLRRARARRRLRGRRAATGGGVRGVPADASGVAARAKDLQGLLEAGLGESSPTGGASPVKAAGPPRDLMDELDGGGPAPPAARGARPSEGPAPPPPKVFDRQQLVAEREAGERQRVEEANRKHLEAKAAEEKLKKDKVDEGNRLHQDGLATWAKTADGTTFKDIKALLSTVDKVIWENSGWEPVSLADLLEPPKVKKAYRKDAIIMCHPDRQQESSAEVQVRADRIFEALNAAFKNST
ncbi:unnamed protein product, partial [Prorocentrum cordatum]